MTAPSTFRSLGIKLSCLAAALLTGACVTTRVDESKNAGTGIEQGESIVILASSYHRGNEAEDDFVACVNKQVGRGREKLLVHDSQEFVDALFPWFEPGTAPVDSKGLPELLARPGVSSRIEERGIRYVVWVQGDTETTNQGGSLSCAAGPGGGGCFGFAWWENEADYQAAVWDLRDMEDAGRVSANVNGTSMIPALIVPVPLIARTQTAACKGLAQQLQDFIDESPGI